mmetsp:Transcript_36354/g.114185  ORF Transcript_36354/g.114185 Transcript_36354/m.114185 type:complete len:221 (-) Transcript_36354:15-677(-)
MHPAIPALQRVAGGVRASLGELRHRLLLRLSEPLTLPEALNTVGLLRRLPPPHALSEPQQRSAFLRGRAAYLDKAVATLPPEDTEPVDYLLRRLELCRVHWHDTCVQFRALFFSSAAAAPAQLDSPAATDVAVERLLCGPPLPADWPPAPPALATASEEAAAAAARSGGGSWLALSASDGSAALLDPRAPAAGERQRRACVGGSWGSPQATLPRHFLDTS